jgi:M6 family metalloprotease-like protein
MEHSNRAIAPVITLFLLAAVPPILVGALTGSLEAQVLAPRDFGWAVDRPSTWPSQDLVVIRYIGTGAAPGTYSSAFDPTHSRDYFLSLFFGTGTSGQNFKGFLDQMSSNEIRLGDEGGVFVTLNVYTVPVTDDITMRQDALRAAAAEIDYNRYDDDGNGRIDPSELVVVMIAAYLGSSGGTVRDAGCIRATAEGPQLCMKVGAFGEWSGLPLMAHELVHTFGTVDLYGLWHSGECWNTPASLMGCPGTRSHLDPMHKIRLGWLTPRSFVLDQESYTCDALEAAAVTSVPRRGIHDPILLYETRRGAAEFFVLEYRTPNTVSVPASQNYDSGLAEAGVAAGVAIWHVATNGDATIQSRPAFIKPPTEAAMLSSTPAPGSDDRRKSSPYGFSYIDWGLDSILQTTPVPPDVLAYQPAINLVRSPDGVLAQPRSAFWRSEHGRFRLRWLDGEDVGVSIRVGPAPSDADRVDVLVQRDCSESPPMANDDLVRCYQRVTGETVDVSLSERDAVLYGVKPEGSLVWYRHLARPTGQGSWANCGTQRVLATGSGPGSGWSAFRQVVGGGEGVLYAIKRDGSLVWYRHLARSIGQSSWANSGTQRVLVTGSGPGSAWSAFKQVAGGGEGVLYAIKQDGSLAWYKHEGWREGTSSWANGGTQRVLVTGSGPGSAWSAFKQVVSGGEGVLYAIKQDGSLVWYKHEGWRQGTNTWANGGTQRVLVTGSGPGSAWAQFEIVVALMEREGG